jgi:hypothetical protein
MTLEPIIIDKISIFDDKSLIYSYDKKSNEAKITGQFKTPAGK